MRKKTILISLLIVCALFALGARSRYGPVFWRAVSGGIEYVTGNVTITNGDLTVSGDMLESADVIYPIKTVIKTIDLDDDASTDDFTFDDDAADTTEQTVDLGALVPAYAEILSAQVRCFETVGDSNVMALDLGTSDGGNEILATANTDTANDINATAAGDGPEVVATNAARHIWINATPDADWDTLASLGRWSVMVTYVDYGAVHTAGIP